MKTAKDYYKIHLQGVGWTSLDHLPHDYLEAFEKAVAAIRADALAEKPPAPRTFHHTDSALSYEKLWNEFIKRCDFGRVWGLLSIIERDAFRELFSAPIAHDALRSCRVSCRNSLSI